MYKFEKFKDARFPVYSSIQKGMGEIVIPHFHECAELIKIVGGSAQMHIDDQNFDLKAGDVVFIPSYRLHSLVGMSEDTEIAGIVFDLSLITPEISGYSATEILSPDRIFVCAITRGSAAYPRLNTAINAALEAYNRNEGACKLKILSALLTIAALLVELHPIDAESTAEHDRLRPVLDYINAHYHEKITISQLSNKINVCDDHLIRLFKSTVKVTPIKFINHTRLREAINLLANTERSVTDIAYSTGFSDANYMTRIFKSTLNITPTQYRKKAFSHNSH